jgi:hypothetical protein
MSGTARFANERGVALVVALFALVVMGALVAGSFVAGRLEQQSGRNTLFASQAAEAAEAGLADALITLSSGNPILPPLGAQLELDTLRFAAGFRVERQVTRLTSALFLVRSTGTRLDAGGQPLAMRVVGVLVRLDSDSLGASPRTTPLAQRAWVQLH